LITEKAFPLKDGIENKMNRGSRAWNKYWGIALTDTGRSLLSERLQKSKKNMKEASLPAAASKKQPSFDLDTEDNDNNSSPFNWIVDWAKSAPSQTLEFLKVQHNL
jgi:hypothetical protein